jgi:hypothetical protein
MIGAQERAELEQVFADLYGDITRSALKTHLGECYGERA